ncbi:MAG: hypothetical protein NC548_05690 [Lachnospiraceae bacterium]|nr:hypothetical protein [Lachnospiraceae bacterium]
MRSKEDYYKLLQRHYPNLYIADLGTQQAMLEYLSMETYTDTIEITRRDIIPIAELWDEQINTSLYVPADILLANTIPLPAIEIKYHMNEPSEKDVCQTYYVNIWTELLPLAAKRLSEENHTLAVGIVSCPIIDIEGTYCGKLAAPIIVGYGMPTLGMHACGWKLNVDVPIDSLAKLIQTFWENAPHWMYIWYNIQFGMLHPIIRKVLASTSTSIPMQVTKSAKKKKRRSVKYIRRHIVNATDIRAALESSSIVSSSTGSSDKKYHRHTMSWYVTGHWRTNKKTGKAKFIQGFWKGPLRQVQRNLDDGRDREVIVT